MCITEHDPPTGRRRGGRDVEEFDEREWCGTGWTGQPIVWERPDGVTEVIIGGFDGLVYFLDGDTGERLRAPFRTGFQIKGTGALDPDGYPLYYTGSRDGRFRILALDREPVVELWGMDAHPQRVWNNDWDGSPAIVDDLLLVGGEDSWFRAVRLNRAIDADGLVTVDPEVLVEVPGFDDELFAAVGDRNVSIENSVAVDVARDRVAFANSGGRVLVLGLVGAAAWRVEVLLDVWLGDDIDASLVIDPDDGAIYVAIELQRFLPRAAEVGQLVRLDPDRRTIRSCGGSTSRHAGRTTTAGRGRPRRCTTACSTSRPIRGSCWSSTPRTAASRSATSSAGTRGRRRSWSTTRRARAAGRDLHRPPSACLRPRRPARPVERWRSGAARLHRVDARGVGRAHLGRLARRVLLRDPLALAIWHRRRNPAHGRRHRRGSDTRATDLPATLGCPEVRRPTEASGRRPVGPEKKDGTA
jgi:hypothetical protein